MERFKCASKRLLTNGLSKVLSEYFVPSATILFCVYRTLTNDRFYSAPAHRMRSGSCENVELDFFQPPKSGCPSFDRFMKGVEHMPSLFKTIMSSIFAFLIIS